MAVSVYHLISSQEEDYIFALHHQLPSKYIICLPELILSLNDNTVNIEVRCSYGLHSFIKLYCYFIVDSFCIFLLFSTIFCRFDIDT